MVMGKSHIELHVHPFLGRNSLIDVVKAMEDTGLDILALESLDGSLYPYVVEEAKKAYPQSQNDSAGVRLPNGRYLLNAREYNTSENFHVLTVGYSLDTANPQTEIRRVIDSGLENGALILLDHPFIDNGKTKTAGHISEHMEQELEKLCKEYSGQVTLEWNGYCIPWMRQVLKYGLNTVGFDIKYHDVNQRAEELSKSLSEEGYNVPVLADTDLHARTKRHLHHMGTARIVTDVQGDSGKEVVESMRQNIFDGNYENVRQYVSSLHLLEAFCVPILMPNHFYKPRA
jgi:hypothetical protein